ERDQFLNRRIHDTADAWQAPGFWGPVGKIGYPGNDGAGAKAEDRLGDARGERDDTTRRRRQPNAPADRIDNFPVRTRSHHAAHDETARESGNSDRASAAHPHTVSTRARAM